MPEHFDKVPRWILASPEFLRLSGKAAKLLLFICHYRHWGTNTVTKGMREIAVLTGMHRNVVQSGLSELQDLGMIVKGRHSSKTRIVLLFNSHTLEARGVRRTVSVGKRHSRRDNLSPVKGKTVTSQVHTVEGSC